MKFSYSSIFTFYRNIKSKIVFYPTLFALSGLLFAFVMMYLENRGISRYLVDNVPVLVVNNGDTALTILSACITGLISMMVFSFSMVMLLLNQASTNYSPRLLPGLISDRNHQFILGIYLASILYCVFILFSIQPTGDKYQVPGFSVLLGILFTVACIYAFIYFIHNISQNIQITYILDKTFLSAKETLEKLLKHENDLSTDFPDTDNWKEYHTEKSGYFQDFSTQYLLDFCKEKEVKLEILPVKGIFVLQGIPVFRCSKELSEEEVENVLERFHFSRAELVSENYILAFKQITEVIVKAMSPGINDPGTALNAIDYLTELLQLRMLKADETFISDDNENYVKVRSVNFDELLYNVMAAIRTYCKQDIIVVQKVGTMFYYLQTQKVQNDKYYKTLSREAERMLEDAGNVLDNHADLAILSHISHKLQLPQRKE
ncbi:Uncharacterized membrane protein [Salinimicrobium catena]|uniref:Uncharacterized membrane protein n=1 Tax=Salinimicrobium catena TaxID=390640 RepID=A0A1H5L6L4_9FLAO|nr:DUF2254 domain-containing protein [Salinimicrobium catena]SDL06242.1 Uncharacterized membrane protein [Salinimicrobium catena]SEE72610.1 Uncharacterized membrane protein [Salinimicrobium catena]